MSNGVQQCMKCGAVFDDVDGGQHRCAPDQAPREIDAALETKEYKEWRASGRATMETCPLTIKVFEQVRMIEKSAFDRVCKERDEWRHEAQERSDAYGVKCAEVTALAAQLAERNETIPILRETIGRERERIARLERALGYAKERLSHFAPNGNAYQACLDIILKLERGE